MEQKRTLWILAAAGVFLCVVFVAALILYAPASRSEKTTAYIVPETQPVSSGWIASSAPAQEASTGSVPQDTQSAPDSSDSAADEGSGLTQVGSMTVIAGTTNVYSTSPAAQNAQPAPAANANATVTTTIDLNTIKSQEAPVNTYSYAAPDTDRATAQENTAVSSSASVSSPAGTVSSSASVPAASETKPATPKRVPAASSAKTDSPKKKATAKAATSAKPAQYWVQTISCTSRKSAENARDILSDSRIPAEIFTYTDSKGKVFYRVRVGPYTTKSEAEYWQNRIIKIDTFKGTSSYITDSSAPAK